MRSDFLAGRVPDHHEGERGYWMVQGSGDALWVPDPLDDPGPCVEGPRRLEAASVTRPVDPECESRVVARCTDEGRAWVRELGQYCDGLTVSQTIWQGLRRLAEAVGFRQPPPRRRPPHRDRPLIEPPRADLEQEWPAR